MMKKEFVVLILLMIGIVLISGCAEKECETDADCLAKTCFTVQCKDNKCVYYPVTNCCGNEKCDGEEDYNNCPDDCPNCDDNNKFTKDSFNYKTQECENTELELLIKNDIVDYKYVESVYGGDVGQLPLYAEEGEKISIIKCVAAIYKNSIGQGQVVTVCPYDNRQDVINSLAGLPIDTGFVSGEYKGEKVYQWGKEVILWANNAYIIASGTEPGSGVPPAEVIISAYLKKYPNDLG